MSDVVRATSETYDRIATAYDEQTRQPSPEFLAHREAFLERTAPGMLVADLGCGPGRDLAMLRAAGCEALGVDLSPGMLALARERGPVVRGDLRHPPLRRSSLGAVWSSAALLHVPREEVSVVLSTWRDLLTPGGFLGLSTSLGVDEGWERVPYATPLPTTQPLSRWFVHHDEQALLGMVSGAGFTVQRTARRATHRDWLMVLATT